MSKSSAPKASGASAQILASVQETLELCKNTNARLSELESRVRDIQEAQQGFETKLDAARLTSSAKSRGAAAKAGSKKDDDKKPAIPSMKIWFTRIWKEDPEGTVSKFCDEDKVAHAEAEVKKNPKTKNKEGDAFIAAVASYYYTKYFTGPTSATYDKEGRDKLKDAHDEMKAEKLKEAEEAKADEGDDGEGADEE
jgi:hypothetical protein